MVIVGIGVNIRGMKRFNSTITNNDTSNRQLVPARSISMDRFTLLTCSHTAQSTRHISSCGNDSNTLRVIYYIDKNLQTISSYHDTHRTILHRPVQHTECVPIQLHLIKHVNITLTSTKISSQFSHTIYEISFPSTTVSFFWKIFRNSILPLHEQWIPSLQMIQLHQHALYRCC